MALVEGYSSSSEDEELNLSKKTEVKAVFPGNLDDDLLVHRASGESELRKRDFASTIEKVYYDEALLKLKLDKSGKKNSKKLKNKRLKNSNPEDEDYMGPWAKYEESDEDETQLYEDNYEGNGDKKDQESLLNDIDEDNGEEEENRTTTEFLGSTGKDYLGRTYMHIPNDILVDLRKDPRSIERFVPKKVIYTFKGHTKGITKLQFFPKSGHLLLSASNDGKIILWDMYHNRGPLRGFYGHNQAVKDICFNNNGSQFLSCSFDKSIHLWDTETGEILKSFKFSSVPNTICFNPMNDNEFVVGLSNHKIEHFDVSRVEYQESIRTYAHHMGAINTIINLDNDKFISTSDDKSVRIWRWNVNIPIKVISSPQQYSMPAAVSHPEGNYFALQSMDNSIQVVHNSGKFKFNRKKKFAGHSNSGYGIDIDISPDGKIIMSGDAKGFGYFWDWKSTKIVTKIKVSDKLISCIKFHPQETSKVVMAGSSGDIYLCD